MRLQSFRSASAGADEQKNEIAAAGSAIVKRLSADRRELPAPFLSFPGLTRASTSFFLRSANTAWMAGRRRAEATPSFGRLCPAMTACICLGALASLVDQRAGALIGKQFQQDR